MHEMMSSELAKQRREQLHPGARARLRIRNERNS
jgi:hypothetical protein